MTANLSLTLSAKFETDEDSRTFAALVVPWNAITIDHRRVAFAKGSVAMPENPGRIKLLADHTASVATLVGKALSFEETDMGLIGTFQVAEGPDGDRLLSLIRCDVLDGVSMGVYATDTNKGFGYEYDEEGDTYTIVSGAALSEVSLVAIPAFDSARVMEYASFAALFHQPTEEEIHSMDNITVNLDTTEFAAAVAEGITAALDAREAFEPQGVMTPTVHTEPRPVYGPGSEYSFVKDAYFAGGHAKDARPSAVDDARARYAPTEAKLATGSLTVGSAKFRGEDVLTFVDESTTRQPALVPTETVNSMYQGLLLNSTPLLDCVTVASMPRGQSDFRWPKFVGYSGLWAEVAEGVNPSDGNIETDEQQVSTYEMAGSMTLTRRVLESANPSIDTMALAAMADARTQFVQTKATALLASIADADTGPGASLTVTGDAQDLFDALDDEFVDASGRPGGFQFTHGAITPAVLKVLRKARDANGHLLFPRFGGSGDYGTAVTRSNSVVYDGIPLVGAPSLTSGGDNYLVNRGALIVWVSPVLSFRFEEVAGPGKIKLAAHGYGAHASIRDAFVTRFTYAAA